ncbi:MAG: hypothetical protein ABI222_01360 [Opitutaceae bacterium]
MEGATITSGTFRGVLGANWTVSRVGDLDGDGKADIFPVSVVTTARAMWLMNGAAIASGASVGVLATNWMVRN